MIMYIDILFVKEIIINFIIIYLTSKFSSQKTTLIKIFISSLVASIFTILTLLFSINVTNILKLICATIIVNIAFKFNSIYTYMSTVVLFYIVTFFVGGIFLYAKINELNTFSFVLTIIFLFLILIKEYKKKYQIQSYIAETQIFDKNQTLKTLIDTGHNLTTCYGEPVIVLSHSWNEKMKDVRKISKGDRTVSYKTIQHESVIVKGEKITNIKVIYRETEYVNEAVIIISDVDFYGYDAIMGLNFFEHATKSNVTKENKKKKKKENKYGDIIFN